MKNRLRKGHGIDLGRIAHFVKVHHLILVSSRYCSSGKPFLQN